MKLLIWAMLGTLLVVPADWDEQPEWWQWRQRRCDQASLDSRRASAKIRELDRLPPTDEHRAERLTQQRVLLDALKWQLRCSQM